MAPIDKNRMENAIIEPVELDRKELTFKKIKIHNNNNPTARENLYKNPVLKSLCAEKCFFLNMGITHEIISGSCVA